MFRTYIQSPQIFSLRIQDTNSPKGGCLVGENNFVYWCLLAGSNKCERSASE